MQTRRQLLLPMGGCLFALLAVVLWVAVLLGRAGPYVVGLLAVSLVAVYMAMRRRKSRAAAAFEDQHGPGKDLLIVYSDSPHWGEYIEREWLRRWGHRAVVFNRSRPWSESQPEAQLWRAVAGTVEHTPVAIVVPRRGLPRVVRFFLAFRDFKHGKDRKLREAEARLERLLGG